MKLFDRYGVLPHRIFDEANFGAQFLALLVSGGARLDY